MTNIIANAAVLVELNISVWGASRLDKIASDKVVSDAGATESDAAQVRKNLLAGDKTRKDIADYAAGCRMWHNRQTMPWSDKGPRLLPTSLFLDYKQVANVHEAEFKNRVAIFLAAYPQLRLDAQKRLGTLFNADEYPDTSEVASKFDFKLVFSPVPDSGHFCVDTTVDGMELALEEMKSSYDNAFASRLNEVMEEPWERLYETLDGMSEKMTEEDTPRFRNRTAKDGTKVQQVIKRPYHESFLVNAEQMVDMLKHLNITDDKDLTRARLALGDAIATVDIEGVREDPDVRAEIKRKVDAILVQHADKFARAEAKAHPERVAQPLPIHGNEAMPTPDTEEAEVEEIEEIEEVDTTPSSVAADGTSEW